MVSRRKYPVPVLIFLIAIKYAIKKKKEKDPENEDPKNKDPKTKI